MRGTSIPYYNALNRHQLMMGVERRLFFLMTALSASIAFTALFRPLMLVISLSLFAICLTIGRSLTRNDAQFLGVYKRHLLYKKIYYPYNLISSPYMSCEKSVPLFSSRRH